MIGWYALRKLFERLGLVGGDDGDGGTDFWASVPREQWGRFVDAGSLTVTEQEDSLADVQEQAEQYREFQR